MFKKPVRDDWSFVTWCIILLEVSLRRWVHCSHKGMDMVSNNTQVGCGVFIRCSIGTKGPKVCQENIPHTNTTSLNRWDKAGWIHAFMFFTPNSVSTIWMSQAEVETHQTRQRISNLLLSNFSEPLWIVSSVCYSYLTGAAPGVVFCCWSPSASGFDVLCVQRWYSAYLGFNKLLFELLLPFYHL